MTRTVLLAVLVSVLTVGLSTPAAAASSRPDASPTFAAKHRVVFDPSHGPWRTRDWGVHRGWRLWKVVQNYDRRFGNIDLRVGQCYRYKHAGCIQVRGVARDGNWWGNWDYRGDHRGVIKLNRAHGRDRHVTCHEVGHALGLRHHDMRGCVNPGSWWRNRASRPEMRELRQTYREYRQHRDDGGSVTIGSS